MALHIDSEGIDLRSHLSIPSAGIGQHGVVLCHGFPRLKREAASAGLRYPEVADRIAEQMNMAVLTFNFRGTGQSEGDFSMSGWCIDLLSAVRYLKQEHGVQKIWLIGFGTGASIAIVVAANSSEVDGVAAFSARAHFDDWAVNGPALLDHAKSLGMIRTEGFPPDLAEWTRDFEEVRPLSLIDKVAPRPLMIVHGRDDERVPVADARELAAAAGEGSELRIISNAGHRLQSDPRTVALLLGWLEFRR